MSSLRPIQLTHRRANQKAAAALENKNGKNEPSPIFEHRANRCANAAEDNAGAMWHTER